MKVKCITCCVKMKPYERDVLPNGDVTVRLQCPECGTESLVTYFKERVEDEFDDQEIINEYIDGQSENLQDVLDNFEARLLLEREAYEKEQEEHLNSVDSLTEYWIEKGHKVLSPDHWDMWSECVPIRLKDLYKGMELKCTIDIIESLNENNYVQAKERLDAQGHSGMSYSLVKCMVKDFCYKGEDFYRWIDDL